MTPQDNWRPEMARLAQRQDQLERQQRETTTRVDALNRDVDRRMDSLRGEMDSQSGNRDWRVSSPERSRDTFENLFWLSIPLVAAVAVIIILVIAVVAAREQRQEAGEPEQRSPSSINAPMPVPEVPCNRGLAAAGTPIRQPHRRPGDLGRRSRRLLFSSNPSTGEERPPIESQSYRVGRVTPQLAICFLTGPADPAWSSRYLQPGSRLHAERSQGSRNSAAGPAPEPHTAAGGFLRGTTACV